MRIAILFLFISTITFGQSTDAQLATQKTNTIVGKPYSPSNTASMDQAIFDSKFSRLESNVTGGTNTYTVSIAWLVAYTNGLWVQIYINSACTGSSTLNINSLGAKTIKNLDGSNTVSGDLKVGPYVFYYDGTNFIKVSGGAGSSSTLTNSGAAGEMVKSDGTNLVGTGVYSLSNSSVGYKNNFSSPDISVINSLQGAFYSTSKRPHWMGGDSIDYEASLPQQIPSYSIASLTSWSNVGSGTNWTSTPSISMNGHGVFTYSAIWATSLTLNIGQVYNVNYQVTFTSGTPLFAVQIVSLNSSNAVIEILHNSTGSETVSLHLKPTVSGGVKIGIRAETDDTSVSETATINTFTINNANATVNFIPQSNGTNASWISASSLTAGSVANALTVDNSSLQLNSGTTFDGSIAKTISVKAAGITNAMLSGGITDGNLATAYLKADGSRSLTADWAVGTFNITGIKSFAISGTAGNGYGEFIAQSSNTSAPSSSGFRLFAGSTGSFNWARKNGSDTYVRTFDATLTANRTYTLQDVSSTMAMYSDNLGSFASTTSAQLATTLSDETGSTSGGLAVFNNSPAFTGTPTIGTMGFSDTGNLFTMQSSTNSYNQLGIQNTNNGASASTNFVVNNDQATSTTHYAEFGKNSSGFTGSGSFNLAGASYLDDASDDLVIGTLANKSIHFVTNGATTDAYTISGGSVLNGSFAYTGSGSFTSGGGTTSNNSDLITMTSTTGINVGDAITGTNISGGSYVRKIVSSTQLRIAGLATGTGSSITFTIYPLQKQFSLTPTFSGSNYLFSSGYFTNANANSSGGVALTVNDATTGNVAMRIISANANHIELVDATTGVTTGNKWTIGTAAAAPSTGSSSTSLNFSNNDYNAPRTFSFSSSGLFLDGNGANISQSANGPVRISGGVSGSANGINVQLGVSNAVISVAGNSDNITLQLGTSNLTWAPTGTQSGNFWHAKIQSVINMASGTTGNLYGIDYNPTLTALGTATVHYGLLIRSATRNGFGLGATLPTALLHLAAGTSSANTAPLKFTTPSNLLTTPEALAIEPAVNGDYLNFTTTTGTVRRVIVAGSSGRSTAQTAANSSVATYTLGATDATYEVSANVLVTTSSAENFTVTASYTDEGNTARVITLNFQILAGTIATAINFANGAVPYEGIPLHIRCKASTSITIKTTGTFTGATYNVEGIIKQTN